MPAWHRKKHIYFFFFKSRLKHFKWLAWQDTEQLICPAWRLWSPWNAQLVMEETALISLSKYSKCLKLVRSIVIQSWVLFLNGLKGEMRELNLMLRLINQWYLPGLQICVWFPKMFVLGKICKKKFWHFLPECLDIFSWKWFPLKTESHFAFSKILKMLIIKTQCFAWAKLNFFLLSNVPKMSTSSCLHHP